MTPILQAFSAALLHFVWQGALVAVLVWTALRVLEKRSANLRYAICCGALLLLAVLPVITTWMLLRQGASAHVGLVTANVTVVPGAAAAVPTARGHVDWLGWLRTWALPIWSIGVLFFSVRMAWGCMQLAGLRRRGERAGEEILSVVQDLSDRMGLTRAVEVVVSELTSGPSVAGWLRPVIFLPASAITGLSADQLEAILAHELAHIRRHDYLVNLLQMGVETLLFYHPAVWWVSARIRGEREFCCDDLAVRTCHDALGYARALSVLERLRLTTPATALGSTGGPLLRRIQRIVGAPATEYGPSRLSGILALAVGLASVALNVGLVRGQAQEQERKSSIFVSSMGVKIVAQLPIEFPPSARGNVGVRITTDSEGNVTEANLIERVASPAPQELQQTVLESVRKWRFAEGDGDRPAPDGSKVVVVVFRPAPPPLTAAQKFMQEGDGLFREGKSDEALRSYEQGEQKFPEHKIEFLKRETEVKIRQGDQAGVKSKLGEIFKENPNDVEARGLRASIKLDENGDVGEVMAELGDVIRAKPDNFVARFNLGRAYFAQGQLDQAVIQFNAALRLRPDYMPALYGRTQIEIKRGDNDAALHDTEAILRQKPGDPTGKILQAGTLARLKRYDEARAMVQEVLAKEPRNQEALQELKAIDEMQK